MMGDPRELHSETKHILSPAECTQQKVDTIEEYPTKDNMSNALNTGQELRYVVKQVTGDSDKPLSMLCEQLGIRLTKDERKPSIQVALRIMCSSFMGNLNEHISMCEE